MAPNPQFKKWVFTINNPQDGDDPSVLFDSVRDSIRYAVWQLEQGENGTPHYQGFVLWKSRGRRFRGMKELMPRAHLEPAKGRCVDNKKYCTKEEGRIDGPCWIIGGDYNGYWD